MGSMPRRARQPGPASASPRSRVAAACAVLIAVAQLLLAPLALALMVAFVVTGRVSRWRLWWLTAPAAVGLAWALAIGPRAALAGFTAGAAHVLGYLGRARLSAPSGSAPSGLGTLGSGTRGSAAAGQSSGLFAGAGSWLPRQLPVALIAGSAEAALIGWLARLPWLAELAGLRSRPPAWSRTGGPTVPPRRPGLVAAVRTAVATSLIRSGAVVTRDGCALGVELGTGAVAQLRWREIADGLLVAGAADREVTVTCLQVAHAALRRRKPLIVLDMSADATIARALAAACTATGTPLSHEQAGSELGPVISGRSAVMIRVGSAELAARACADVAAVADRLRRIGVDGDGLVWVTDGGGLPTPTAAALIGAGRAGGLAVLIAATSPTAAAALAGQAGASLVLRIADPGLAVQLASAIAGQAPVGDPARAAILAASIGGRLGAAGPGGAAGSGGVVGLAGWGGVDEGAGAHATGAGPGVMAGQGGHAGSGGPASEIPARWGETQSRPGAPSFGLAGALQFAGPTASGEGPGAGEPGTPPVAAVSAEALMTLRRGEFVLAVSGPRRRLVERGRLVPGRLLRPAARPATVGRERWTRRLRDDPA
jgi:hypothetical protein